MSWSGWRARGWGQGDTGSFLGFRSLGLLREAVLHLPAEPADGLTSPSPAVRRLVDRSEPTQMA